MKFPNCSMGRFAAATFFGGLLVLAGTSSAEVGVKGAEPLSPEQTPVSSPTTLKFTSLKPLMAQLEALYFAENFDSTNKIDTAFIEPQENSRWSISDKHLIGIPSTEEDQLKTSAHNGAKPSIYAQLPDPNVCVSFKIRYSGLGVIYKGGGFGITRYGVGIKLNAVQTSISADHNHLGMMHSDSHQLVEDQWYECLLEIVSDEIVVQIKDGPTLYGKHDTIFGKHGSVKFLAENGLPHHKPFGFFGADSCSVYIDDLEIWSAKKTVQEGWAQRRQNISKDYADKYQHGPYPYNRDEIQDKLNVLAEQDPKAKEIAELRAREKEIKARGKDAKRKAFEGKSDEEKAKKKTKDEVAAERRRKKKTSSCEVG